MKGMAKLGAANRNDNFRSLVQDVFNAVHVAEMNGLKSPNIEPANFFLIQISKPSIWKP
jgi:hypothetical protein